MRSIAIDRFGERPSVHDVDVPEPGNKDVRVAVRAAGVNPVDWKLANDTKQSSQPFSFPLVLGFDFAGIVDSLGDDVTEFEVGDQVYGSARRDHGSFAEFAIARIDSIAPMPTSLNFAQAAAVPISAMTALNSLDCLGVSEGDTLLVVGATGGVGSFAVQIASELRCRVIATARDDSDAMMRSLGAHDVIDYTRQDVVSTVDALYSDGIDALLDVVSNAEEFDRLCTLLRPGSRALSTIGAADVTSLAIDDIEAFNIVSQMSREGLERITAMFDAGTLVAPIEHTFAFEEANQALAASELGHVHGKLVLDVA